MITGLLSSNQAQLSGTVWSGRRVGSCHERHAVVGTDGGASRSPPRPLGQAERHEGDRPRRRRLRDDRGLRARQARIQRPYSRGTRSGRRRELDAPARSDAHRARSRRRNTGLQFRRGSLSQRRPVAASSLAHRRPRLLQGAGSAARDLHQRERIVLLLLRGGEHRTTRQQARSAARGEGRHDRLHLRADGQGDQPGRARHSADSSGQGAVRHLPCQRGLPRLRGSRVQEEHRARTRRSERLPGAAAVRLRQPHPIGHRRHGNGADVPARRRHGPVPERVSSGSSATRSRSAPRSSRFIRPPTA